MNTLKTLSAVQRFPFSRCVDCVLKDEDAKLASLDLNENNHTYIVGISEVHD
jgi:hypothetical protein